VQLNSNAILDIIADDGLANYLTHQRGSRAAFPFPWPIASIHDLRHTDKCGGSRLVDRFELKAEKDANKVFCSNYLSLEYIIIAID
jgi:hypothetical protein